MAQDFSFVWDIKRQLSENVQVWLFQLTSACYVFNIIWIIEKLESNSPPPLPPPPDLHTGCISPTYLLPPGWFISRSRYLGGNHYNDVPLIKIWLNHYQVWIRCKLFSLYLMIMRIFLALIIKLSLKDSSHLQSSWILQIYHNHLYYTLAFSPSNAAMQIFKHTLKFCRLLLGCFPITKYVNYMNIFSCTDSDIKSNTQFYYTPVYLFTCHWLRPSVVSVAELAQMFCRKLLLKLDCYFV